MRCPGLMLLAAVVFALTVSTGSDAAPAATDPPDREHPSFALRAVKLGGEPDAPETRAHLAHCRELGFDAIWVPSSVAGDWSVTRAPDGPRLDASFLALREDLAPWDPTWIVELNPVLHQGDGFAFTDREARRRLVEFLGLLRTEAEIDHVVVSFDGAPLRLTDVRDIVRYGRPAAKAHVELARHLVAGLPRKTRVWLAPAVSSDRHLDDRELGYGPELERSLRRLPRRVGIAWSGPDPVSASISVAAWTESRRRLGGRSLLLHDRYPGDWARGRLPLAAVIGPLRNRDPGLAGAVDGYVASPAGDLAISRLTLATVAAYLRDPQGYDPDRESERLARTLAGDDPRALDALRTQLLEWGGWVGERNYRTALESFPANAASRLRDPAFVASWSWAVRRYPDRIAALSGLKDETFRDALQDTMRRRLAVARAIPHAEALRSRDIDGPEEVRTHVAALRRIRATTGGTAAVALDLFLAAAGLDRLLEGPADQDR